MFLLNITGFPSYIHHNVGIMRKKLFPSGSIDETDDTIPMQ